MVPALRDGAGGSIYAQQPQWSSEREQEVVPKARKSVQADHVKRAPTRAGPPEPRANSIGWAAKVLGVSERTVRAQIASGALRARKLGKRILIYGEDLEAFRRQLPPARLKS
jgi:excisionase family DNA binding protein